MFWLIALTLLVLLVAAAAWGLRAGFVSFRRRFHDYVAEFPDIRVLGETSSGVRCTVLGLALDVDLLESYVFHLRRRELETTTFDRIVTGLRHQVPPVTPPPFLLVQDRVLPVIKREEGLVLAQGYRGQHQPVRSPFVTGLVIGYVIEGQFQMTVITEGMLGAWGIAIDDLHATALANLRKKTAHLLDELGGPHAEYVSLDGYEAARLLVADLIVPPEIPNPVLAIPHEHACVIAPADRADELAARAAAMRARAEFPLSARLFTPGAVARSSEGQPTD